MASVDQKLYRELRSRYPEVPDNVVTTCMTKLGNDRKKCMETLTQKSPKYLYGHSTPGMNDPFGNFAESPAEPRPRSDSSSSNMSNASSGSASSRPPFHTSFSNTPGHRGPITITDDGVPTSAPVRSSDINQFIHNYEGSTNSHIPQISCNNNNFRAGHDGQKSNYFGPSGNCPTLPVKPGLRHIEVQHIQTNMEQVDQPPPGYAFQIRIDRSGHPAGTTTLPASTERGGWNYHPVNHYRPGYPNTNLQNNPQNTAFPSDLQPLPLSPFDNMNIAPSISSRFQSPTEEYGPNYGAIKHNQSSQATIYLRGPNTQTNLIKSPTAAERTIHSPLPGQNSALSDQRISSSNYMRNMPVLQNTHDLSNSQNPQGINRNIIVEITSARREGGVQSQIQYFNDMASGSTSGGQSPHGSTVIGSSGQFCDNLVGGEQGQTVISPSHEEGGFLRFPPMPNICRVPGHPQGPMHFGVSDNDTLFHGDYRQNPRPFISPTSSQSSRSSDSPAVINTTHPGPLIQDEGEEYTQVLLSHQKSRMQKLIEDLSAAEDRLQQLKNEVESLQISASDRQRKLTSQFPSAVDLTKLRGDNLQLQADIQLMTREIDMYNNGQTPLGVLDPLEDQDFYTFPNKGQRGSIYASSGEPHPNKVFTSTVTTSVTPSLPPQPHRPPAPEIPSSSLPPTLPPRERIETPPPLPPRSTVVTSQIPPPPPHQPAVGSGDSDADGDQWSCSACTFLNHPALNKCECCEMPRMNFSSVSSPRDVPDTYPSSLQSTQSP